MKLRRPRKDLLHKAGIPKAIATLGVAARELTQPENDAFRAALADKFGRNRRSWRLWQDVSSAEGHTVAMQDQAGWLMLVGFLTDEPVYLLVDDDPSYGFALASGKSVLPILAETPHFEISITNAALDYVLCFNAYDFLIAGGTARDWLRTLIAGVRT